jgi:hypothetical protein
MRRIWLCAFIVMPLMCGTAAAQVGVLVEQDTSKDPCAGFKMRVLVPAGTKPRPRQENPPGLPDPGIIWNPCRVDLPQLAGGPTTFIPEPGTPLPSPAAPPFKLQPTPAKDERDARTEVLSIKLPPAFEMMRRR